MHSFLKNIFVFIMLTCFCLPSLSQSEKNQKIPVASNKPYKIERSALSSPVSIRYSYEFTKIKSDQNSKNCEQKNNILNFWCLTTSKISIFFHSLFKLGSRHQASPKHDEIPRNHNQYSWNYKDSSAQ